MTEFSAELEGGADRLCSWSQLTGLSTQDLCLRIYAPGSFFCHPVLCVTSDKSCCWSLARTFWSPPSVFKGEGLELKKEGGEIFCTICHKFTLFFSCVFLWGEKPKLMITKVIGKSAPSFFIPNYHKKYSGNKRKQREWLYE